MGRFEITLSGVMERPLGYHSLIAAVLTERHETGFGTLSGGQFDWGGRLPKSNGGAQRLAQHGRKSCIECNSIRALDWEADMPSR